MHRARYPCEAQRIGLGLSMFLTVSCIAIFTVGVVLQGLGAGVCLCAGHGGGTAVTHTHTTAMNEEMAMTCQTMCDGSPPGGDSRKVMK